MSTDGMKIGQRRKDFDEDEVIRVKVEQVEIAEWQKWLIAGMIIMSLFSWLMFAMM